jgi:nitroreductase
MEERTTGGTTPLPGRVVAPRQERAGAVPAGPGRADLARAVETALRAPSVHNTQPWLWRIGTDVIELHTDRFRHLAATDPDRRDLVVSCGAALHHLRVALAGSGTATEVARLPDPEDRSLLAVVRPVAGAPDPALAALAPAIPLRRTDRRRLSHRAVPADLVEELVDRAGGEGILLVPVTGPGRRDRLLAALAEAAVLQRTRPGYAAELQRWSHRPEHARDGVPAANVPPPPVGSSHSPQQRRFGRCDLAQPPTQAGRHPDDDGSVFLVLATAGDRPLDRLRAGEAASAVLLAATRDGLATTPFSQPVELGESRLPLARDVLRIPEQAQLVLRIGWPVPGAGPIPESPRRRLGAVLLGPD